VRFQVACCCYSHREARSPVQVGGLGDDAAALIPAVLHFIIFDTVQGLIISREILGLIIIFHIPGMSAKQSIK
jgi:hypothetical protein